MNIFRKLLNTYEKSIFKKKLKIFLLSFKEAFSQPSHNGLPLPPPALRYLSVCHKYEEDIHIKSGTHCSITIKNLIKNSGKDIASFQKILEFGCGCGRVIRHLHDADAAYELYGTDVDEKEINWCRKNLNKICHFETNSYLPPLKYETNTFDLIYSISVFTHLEEQSQFLWLKELHRIAKPKSLVIISVNRISMLSDEETSKKGIIVRERTTDAVQRSWLGKKEYPSSYYDAFHNPEYIKREWSKYFRIIDYCPGAITSYQDAVVLEKE